MRFKSFSAAIFAASLLGACAGANPGLLPASSPTTVSNVTAIWGRYPAPACRLTFVAQAINTGGAPPWATATVYVYLAGTDPLGGAARSTVGHGHGISISASPSAVVLSKAHPTANIAVSTMPGLYVGVAAFSGDECPQFKSLWSASGNGPFQHRHTFTVGRTDVVGECDVELSATDQVYGKGGIYGFFGVRYDVAPNGDIPGIVLPPSPIKAARDRGVVLSPRLTMLRMAHSVATISISAPRRALGFFVGGSEGWLDLFGSQCAKPVGVGLARIPTEYVGGKSSFTVMLDQGVVKP